MTNPENPNDDTQRSWLRNERCQIYLIAVGIFAIGIIFIATSIPVYQHSAPWSKGLSEFGIALVIAGVLMGSAERYLKESLFSEIDRKFADTLDDFATSAFDLQQFERMPVRLRERLRDRVLSAPVIQFDATYTYSLSQTTSPENDDSTRVYLADVVSSSKYVNLTTTTQRFLVKEAVSRSPDDTRSNYGFQKITSRIEGNGSFPRELLPAAIENYISQKAGSLLFEREAILAPNAALNIEFESIAYLDEGETISIEAFLPTVNMVCTTSGSELNFRGQAGDALGDIWNVTSGDNGESRWELTGAILPGQGFDIWFEERELVGDSGQPANGRDA